MNGLLVPIDEDRAMADALGQLTPNMALATDLGENGRTHWQANLSPQKVTSDWIAFLEKVAG